MLKTTMSSQMLVANKVLAKNEVDGIESSDKSIEKYGKLLKTGKLSKSKKSKSKKTSKSRNSAKSGKKLSKSRNSTNSNVIEDRPKFLILDARIDFNRLWLAFIEAPIL